MEDKKENPFIMFESENAFSVSAGSYEGFAHFLQRSFEEGEFPKESYKENDEKDVWVIKSDDCKELYETLRYIVKKHSGGISFKDWGTLEILYL